MATTGTVSSDEIFGSKQAAELRALRRRSIDNAARSIMENIPGVTGVCLFGSHARATDTEISDIDLIVVSDRFATGWIQWLPGMMGEVDWYDSNTEDGIEPKDWRIDGFLAVTGFDPEKARSTGYPVCDSPSSFAKIDVFVFPSDWQDPATLRHLQHIGCHRDPHFMSNIARDAVEFDQSAGTFWPSASH